MRAVSCYPPTSEAEHRLVRFCVTFQSSVLLPTIDREWVIFSLIFLVCIFIDVYTGWQWRNFVSYLCHLIFAAILWVKTPRNVCHCDSVWIRFVGKSVVIWTLSQTNWFNFIRITDNSSPFNSTQYIVLYPQNGDRIMTIDSVTSLHHVCYLI